MTTELRKAAFIDRDGTLLEEVNFLSRVEDMRIFPYTSEALEALKQNGFLVIVVTNQSGIGRGIYTEDDMHSIHRAMESSLPELIDNFHFCPHLPDAGCTCRKPNTGMIELAKEKFAIDMERSWMIGDKLLDIETGFNAGTRTALVKTGYGAGSAENLVRRPDIVADDLLEAVRQIISE
ncbi:MAG: HAD family hydrolase [Pyrinomonadaceae bacterium]|nr:HAD family hydrolase [Pyrinomonadaceae bacterium]